VNFPACPGGTGAQQTVFAYWQSAGAVTAEIWSFRMQDAVMLFFTAVFFALAFLYVKACEKLR
jgi:hypothetical protein